ncbi:MAG: class I SAM-dependent methyltransferase [Gemmataceae bacterium]|nr:class I SAM-dependent methyltransferase [Gemmataceae bacterium]
MSDAPLTTYDDVPYADYVFHYSHPDRLATLAGLLGMTTAPPGTCRVLELGCAGGGNLIPMALTLPGSTFLGIDLSPRQIASGQEVVAALGLSNIDLRPLSILDVSKELGQFDYVICHGVYSWVPPAVQDKILAICKENLALNGVAYVSYNTFPGWHLRAMVREMLRYHSGQFQEAAEQVGQARALLDFLIDAAGDPEGIYGSILRKEADVLGRAPDAYLFHEHLEEVNAPVYFHEFVNRASARGLQYLAEARPAPLPRTLSAKAQETLEGLGADLIRAEQYLDFVRNRTFRWTLLCHDRVMLRRPPSATTVQGLQVSALARPVDEGTAAGGEFRTPEGLSLSTQNPLLRAVLLGLLEASPRAVPFAELLEQVRAVVPGAGDQVPEALADALLQSFLAGFVDLHVHPPPLVGALSARPVASALARLQAKVGERVTSLRHRMVELNGFERQVLVLLDGSRDRVAILEALVEAVARKDVEFSQNGRPLEDLDQVRQILEGAVGPTMERLASLGMLQA